MVARKPSVMIGGQQQDLPDGDTILGVPSSSTIKPIRGRATITTSGPFQKFTIADRNILNGMIIVVQPVIAETLSAGILCDAKVTRQAAGSFDVVLVMFGIDGKLASTQLSKRVITLNYIGA